MRFDTERPISIGDSITLNIVEFNGKPVFETVFVYYDAELRARDLKERSIDELDFERIDEFDDGYIEGEYDYKSVRIFHPAQGEQVNMRFGDSVCALVQSARVAREKTKDGRRKLHITVSRVRRQYHWTRCREIDPDRLVITLCCGHNEIKKREIPFTLKKMVRVENGTAYPVIAQVFPNGSILSFHRDTRRPIMTMGDYRLRERQKGRTMQQIEEDFIRVPPQRYDRLLSAGGQRRLGYAVAPL